MTPVTQDTTTGHDVPGHVHQAGHPWDVEWAMSALRHERLTDGTTLRDPVARWTLVLDGGLVLETAAGVTRLSPGDAVLIDGRTARRLTADGGTEVAYGDLRPVGVVPLPSPLVLRGFADRHSGVVALVTTCPLQVMGAPDVFAASYANLIGASVTEQWRTAKGTGAAVPAGRPGTAQDPEVARVLAVIAERPGEPWTLDRMAALVHLSRSSLTERFRRATGHSPMRMLRQVRMHRARTLLADRCLLVTRIALEVGYGSVAAFSRAFTAEHGGVSPLAWRAAPAGAARQAASGARQAHERPAETRRHRGARADQEQRTDAVAVQ